MQHRRQRVLEGAWLICDTSQRRACGVGGVHAVSAMLRKLKGMASSSVGCRSMLPTSTVLASMRGGVPVFSRLSLNP